MNFFSKKIEIDLNDNLNGKELAFIEENIEDESFKNLKIILDSPVVTEKNICAIFSTGGNPDMVQMVA